VSVNSRLLFCLAGGILFLSTARGEPAPDLTGLVADHADISNPRTTLDSLFNLTESFQALVGMDGITFDNQGRLRNINAQFQKLFDLREIPPKYRRHVVAETAVYLREALARHPLPAISDVPDEDRESARAGRHINALQPAAGMRVDLILVLG
jgi:hypothetical protein